VSTTAGIRFAIDPVKSRVPDAERARRLENPGFGHTFSEHMVSLRWNGKQGWHDARLTAYAPVSLDPGTSFLHYAQGVFEGLKAFRQVDGSVAMFRPGAHAARFWRSARRLALPELPEEVFVEALEMLIQHDHAWVPSAPEQSLYLRPFMFATDVGLGVHAASEVACLFIASPSGSYFPRGVKPVTVWLSEEYTRAAPGGTGEAKFGGNYAGSLIAQAQAEREGCDSVVWLDAAEHAWVEEMGGMNLAFVYGQGDDAKLVTPALTGTLLPGVTRDALLVLARDLGYSSEERRVSVDEWRKGNADGTISEVFACGTAAVITPVGEVRSPHGGWTIAGGQSGPITMRLRKALVEIQRGAAPDPHGWRHPVPLG
jgi:branched-chain amino acid aminotransferase